jgi:hypothetical protein
LVFTLALPVSANALSSSRGLLCPALLDAAYLMRQVKYLHRRRFGIAASDYDETVIIEVEFAHPLADHDVAVGVSVDCDLRHRALHDVFLDSRSIEFVGSHFQISFYGTRRFTARLDVQRWFRLEGDRPLVLHLCAAVHRQWTADCFCGFAF